MNMEALKFPVGRFKEPTQYTTQIIEQWIKDIEEFPAKLEAALKGISPSHLSWRYRPEGWNIKQVIHHCVDSHINSVVRFKLAITEDCPTIRPYDQDAWITLCDANIDEIRPSLNILNGLHFKWAMLLKSLTDEQLNRTLIHPEHKKPLTLSHFIGLYAWHCNHHFGHVKQALANKGSFN